LCLMQSTVFSAFYESALSFFFCLVCMYIFIHSVDYAHVSVLLYFCVLSTYCAVCVCTDVGLKAMYHFLKAVEGLICYQGNHLVRILVSLGSSAIFECLDWLLVL